MHVFFHAFKTKVLRTKKIDITSIYPNYIFYNIERPNIAKVGSNVEVSFASGLIIGIIVVTVVVLTLIIIIMVVYKRRVGRLKSVNRAVMQYIQSTEGTDAGNCTNI